MIYVVAFVDTLVESVLRLTPIFSILIAVIVANGLTIGRIEKWSTGDALYHAFINATTVGYGDFRPSKGTTKVLAVINAFLGLLLTGIFVGVGVYAVEAVVKLKV